MSQIWALHDSDPRRFPMKRIKPSEAKALNEQGYGIFWTVQDFHGPRRIENLARINAFAIDMDAGTKDEQAATIARGLRPSLIVETKKGFHVYWRATDARPEHYKAIVADRLVPFYNADPNAKDLARILRMPGFYHMKDPANPFLVRSVYESMASYSERAIGLFYPDQESEKRAVTDLSRIKRESPKDGDFWDRVYNLDCAEALDRLSGRAAVNGEVFSFKRNASGTLNIFVDGKSTSAWIDHNGRIGSMSKGGPTIFQWVQWYGHGFSEALRIIKEVFPELTADRGRDAKAV